jgi:hypothetical protein
LADLMIFCPLRPMNFKNSAILTKMTNGQSSRRQYVMRIYKYHCDVYYHDKFFKIL